MKEIWSLEDINLYKMLCPHRYKKFARNHRFKSYAKDDFVYFQQDSANKIYLISNGKVKIGYYTENGDEMIKSILGKGELFGEKSILGQPRHEEFAQSLQGNTELCELNQETLFDLMRNNSKVSIKVYKFLGIRLKKMERRLEILLFKDTKTRLKEFLNDLKEEYGIKNSDGYFTAIHPYTQNDIAKLIGTSRPTLNVLLRELKEENKIDFVRKNMTFFT